MKVIVTKSHDESGAVAAGIVQEVLKAKPNAKLGLATGSTPVPAYKHLIELYNAGEVDFAAACSVNLDEYVGLAGDHPQSYRYFMDSNLFNHVNIDKASTFVADGTIDPNTAAAQLEEKIFEGGVQDVQILGIGNNGHIAFNEAGTKLLAESHVEPLTEGTIDANARFFASRDDVPTRAITMGMRGIMAAKRILLLATGESKAEAIRGLLADGVVSTQNPSTFLKLHPDVTVIIDEALAEAAAYKG